MSAGYDGSIKIDTSINSSGFNKGVKGLTTSLKSLAIAVGIAFSLSAVIAFGKASVDAASEIQSAFIGLQSIVEGQGKSFSGAKEFINDYIADGLVPAANAVTAYKNLLMRGYSTDQIETVMNALKNASAFGRQGSLTMGQAVQSATEGLKNENSILVDNAGVTKNVSMMWKDYAISIGTTVGALTKEQKIEAEVQGILEETRFQMDDAAKLSQTYAGKISALGVSFKNLKVAIGNSIIPIIDQVVPYIKAAVDALTIYFNQVAQIMNALFGTNVSMASVSDSMTEVADSTQDAADAQDNLADSTGNAAKAAKGALAAFDQLNVLQMQDAGTENAAAAPITLPPVDDSPIEQGTSALEERVLAFKAKFLEYIQPVIDALGRLKESLTPLAETIWYGLKWAWDNILVPLGSWAITDLLPAFLDLLGGAAELLNDILIALQPIWMWFWENFLRPLAEWVGGKIVDFLYWLADALKRLGGWIEQNGTTLFSIVSVIMAIVGVLWLLNAVVGAINVAIGIYNSVMAIVATVTEAVSLPLLLVIALIVAIGVLIYLLITQWDNLSVTVKQIAFIINFYFLQLKEQLSTTIKQLGFIISYYFNQAATSFKDAFFVALDAVNEKFISIFEGLKTFVKGIINGIIDLINGMISRIISGINNVVESANAVGNVLPGYSPIPALITPKIPYLATGAVIPPNSKFAAILGDQKRGVNIEAPADLIRQIVREETGKVTASVTVNFAGSLAGLVRELKPYIDKETVRVGDNLITGGATA
ncbi:MAG: hypothetical protein HY865_22200 [Chloroflexi bacterium]|nr:hypothetical protein [Chloroflexota bacterium]